MPSRACRPCRPPPALIHTPAAAACSAPAVPPGEQELIMKHCVATNDPRGDQASLRGWEAGRLHQVHQCGGGCIAGCSQIEPL